jgi:Tol biopolymer transport system component
MTAKGRWISAVLGLLLLISVGAWLFVRIRDRRPPEAGSATQREFNVVPLTTLPGAEVSPSFSFSPDGSQVVFAWDGGNSDPTNPFNLYVKVIGSEKIERITHEPAEWIVPAWSPDGSTIAFAPRWGPKPGYLLCSGQRRRGEETC